MSPRQPVVSGERLIKGAAPLPSSLRQLMRPFASRGRNQKISQTICYSINMAATERRTWTDQGLDDLSAKVSRADQALADTKSEMRTNYEELQTRINDQTAQLRLSLCNLERQLFWFAVMVVVAFIVSQALADRRLEQARSSTPVAAER